MTFYPHQTKLHTTWWWSKKQLYDDLANLVKWKNYIVKAFMPWTAYLVKTVLTTIGFDVARFLQICIWKFSAIFLCVSSHALLDWWTDVSGWPYLRFCKKFDFFDFQKDWFSKKIENRRRLIGLKARLWLWLL